ncbi:MAG: hypothetical protein LC795_15850 [Acidobacteria bacterium]|nr:hypothetical protein [Acidobacteriota bacterium]
MFRYARTPRGSLRRLPSAFLAVACLLLLGAASARTQTPTPGANSNGTPAVNANGNANTGGVVNINGNANGIANGNRNGNGNGNANAGASPAPAVSPDVTVGAAAKKGDGRDASFTSRWFGIEGPAWMVLLVIALLLTVVIGAMRYVPEVRALFGPAAAKTTRWVILVVVLLLFVFLLGRWFGYTEETRGIRSTTPDASPSPVVEGPAVPTSEVAKASPTPGAAQPGVQPAVSTGARPGASPSPAASPSPTASPTPTPSPTPAPTPYELTAGDVSLPSHGEPTGGEPVIAGLGDEIVVKVNNLGEEVQRQELLKEPAATRLDPKRLVLFLDDVEMKKLYPEAIDLAEDEVRFKLRRDGDTRKAWDDLLAKPEEPFRPVKVGVGPEGKTAWPAAANAAQNFVLRVYSPFRFKLNAVLFLVALAGFLWLAKSSNIIRDSQPPEPGEGESKPYSLARTQVAWWFFIIFGSFLFLWVVTNDYNVFTTSALVLLGIGTGTALGSAMVDASKRDASHSELRTLKPRQMKLDVEVKELKTTLEDLKTRGAAGEATPDELAAAGGQRATLAAKEAELEQLHKQVADAESARSKPVSEGFIRDVLSDVNGVTFHRFQNAVWTISLGIIFIKSVWTGLRMPEYDDIVLALMGISGATYLGFKIPERQTEPGQQPKPPETGAGGQGQAGAGAAAAAAAEADADAAGAAGATDAAGATGSDDASGEAAAEDGAAEDGAAGADDATADAGTAKADDYEPPGEEGK